MKTLDFYEIREVLFTSLQSILAISKYSVQLLYDISIGCMYNEIEFSCWNFDRDVVEMNIEDIDFKFGMHLQ